MNFKDLRKGNRIVEYDMGVSVESVIQTDPVSCDGQDGAEWTFQSVTDDGMVVDYLQVEGFEQYVNVYLVEES